MQPSMKRRASRQHLQDVSHSAVKILTSFQKLRLRRRGSSGFSPPAKALAWCCQQRARARRFGYRLRVQMRYKKEDLHKKKKGK